MGIRFVMRGLDPRIHRVSKRMDCRVKPGNDAEYSRKDMSRD
jgi:hypothetical protein